MLCETALGESTAMNKIAISKKWVSVFPKMCFKKGQSDMETIDIPEVYLLVVEQMCSDATMMNRL